MALIKFLFYTVCSTVIIFFVWNILKRMFFSKFYNYFPHQKFQNEAKNNNNTKKDIKTNKNYKWDAETVDYEELPNDKK